MSISTALSTALTGLMVSGRSADVVSSNIANATTEGYGVRRLSTSSQINGGDGTGVRVNGVERLVDPVLLAERRGADAALGESLSGANYLTRVEDLIGTPNDPASLSASFDAFEASLVSAANRPDSQARLTGVLDAAGRLAGRINTISDGIQDARLDADREIASGISLINDTLERLAELNAQIRASRGGGRDISSMLDHQQALIDGISDLIPLREIRDSTGQVALFASDGTALLDGVPSFFEFTPTPVMAADLTRQNGGLSGLTLNGRPVPLDGAFPALQGGRLAGLFEVRDTLMVTAQAQIDAVARDLAERLDDPAIDPTRLPGDPGLFTDAGAQVSAANEVGLAGRLRINPLVDPAQGGAVWRLRDGLGALAEGPPGQPGLLQTTLDALQAARPTLSGGFSGASRTMAGLAGDFLSMAGIARQSAETALSYASSRHEALKEAELRKGVDTDAEMQALLIIEQVFAANAKMIETVEEMLDQLMRI